MTVLKPARKLFEYLRPRMVLAQINLAHFSKMSAATEMHQFHLLENDQNKFVVEYGAAVENLKFELSENEAFEKLAALIADYKKLRFHLLWLPNRGVLNCAVDIHDDVAVRVIEYYEIRTDEVLTRYDVLVQAVD